MLANVASQVQSDIDAQRDQCHALDAYLARLQTEQTEKDAFYAGLQNTRNTCLLAFMCVRAAHRHTARHMPHADTRPSWMAAMSDRHPTHGRWR